MAAACKRGVQLAVNRVIRWSKSQGFNTSVSAANTFHNGAVSVTDTFLNGAVSAANNSYGISLSSDHHSYRQSSQLPKPSGKHRVHLVNTLALVRRLEAVGVPSRQADALISEFTLVLEDVLENLSQTCISKAENMKIAMTQETAISKFMSEVQSSQGHHFSLMQGETMKFRNDFEKLRDEQRHQFEKVAAVTRMDINHEREQNREELTKQRGEFAALDNKINAEINALKAHMEASKNELLKYILGTIASLSAVGLGLLRILVT